MNNPITILIKLSNKSIHQLNLTPHNYQQQFNHFINRVSLNQTEISKAKDLIQQSIYKRVQQVKAQIEAQQSQINQEMSQFLQGNTINKAQPLKNVKTQKYQDALKKQNPYLQKDNQVRHQQQNSMGYYNPAPKEHPVSQKYDKSDIQKQKFQNINRNLQELNHSHFSNESSGLPTHPNSPKFSNIKDQQKIEELIFKTNSEDDISPRKLPSMTKQSYNSKNKSTTANSPESMHLSYTKRQKKNQNQQPIKKLIFLQNYQKQKENQLNEQGHFLSFKNSGRDSFDNKVFDRLYQAHTTSFQNKRTPQIKVKEEQDYSQMIDYLSKKKPIQINYFQDMSAKTTQSFKSKLEPPLDLAERDMLREQEQMKQILKIREKERKLKEKRNQKYSLQKQKLRGAHCEAHRYREEYEKEIHEREQKQRIIKERVKEKKNIYESSFSPASKSPKSRVCPCCSPSPHKSLTLRQKSQEKKLHSFESPSSKVNKKYVSNILNESYQQFSRQAHKIKK